MNALAESTVSEKVLLAAAGLEDAGQSPFTAEQLIVAVWKKYPQAFGLRGFVEQYPDSNKVLTCLMGDRGLARRGCLAKMGQKLYALTREGRTIVNHLVNGEDAPAPPPARPQGKLSKEREQFLLTLLGSTAMQKFRERRKAELGFADACRFWDITENLNREAIDARLELLQETLTDVGRTLGKGKATLSSGRVVSPEEVAQLKQLHTFMEERFAALLNVLRNRRR